MYLFIAICRAGIAGYLLSWSVRGWTYRSFLWWSQEGPSGLAALISYAGRDAEEFCFSRSRNVSFVWLKGAFVCTFRLLELKQTLSAKFILAGFPGWFFVYSLKWQRRIQLQGADWLPEIKVQLLPWSRGAQLCAAVYWRLLDPISHFGSSSPSFAVILDHHIMKWKFCLLLTLFCYK